MPKPTAAGVLWLSYLVAVGSLAMWLSDAATQPPRKPPQVCFTNTHGVTKCVSGPARCGSDTECEELSRSATE